MFLVVLPAARGMPIAQIQGLKVLSTDIFPIPHHVAMALPLEYTLESLSEEDSRKCRTCDSAHFLQEVCTDLNYHLSMLLLCNLCFELGFNELVLLRNEAVCIVSGGFRYDDNLLEQPG